jgi:hypothetical protein
VKAELFGLALALVANTSEAAVITTNYDSITERQFIDIKGPIEINDAITFDGILKTIKDTSRVVVRLSSPGGKLPSGIRIAQEIHNRHLATYVAKEGYCVSMCAIIWLSGSPRVIENGGAWIGFHQVSRRDQTANGFAIGADAQSNALLGAYLFHLGMSPGAIAWITQKGPRELNWLNADARDKYHIKIDNSDALPARKRSLSEMADLLRASRGLPPIPVPLTLGQPARIISLHRECWMRGACGGAAPRRNISSSMHGRARPGVNCRRIPTGSRRLGLRQYAQLFAAPGVAVRLSRDRQLKPGTQFKILSQ